MHHTPLSAGRPRLRNMTGRLVALLADAQTARRRNRQLRAEARQRLDALTRAVAAAGEARPDPAGRFRPIIPRYDPAGADSLDAVRRSLHEAYAQSRDPGLRAELMESYDGFARSLALKFRHREPLDDLVQVARIGLLQAIDRFDPALGRPFALFARITINGELKRHLRDRTWAVRVPRSLQEDYLNVMRAVDELTAERSDSPSMEAIAAHCGIPVDRVVEALELRVGQRPLSIDAPAQGGPDDAVIELGQEEAGFRTLENRQLLAELLDRLPERDRRIVQLRFLEEMTQAQIASEIGVSQMCVSRVLARTIGRLRLWARTAVA